MTNKKKDSVSLVITIDDFFIATSALGIGIAGNNPEVRSIAARHPIPPLDIIALWNRANDDVSKECPGLNFIIIRLEVTSDGAVHAHFRTFDAAPVVSLMNPSLN